jgi:hypothetical protein
LWSERIPAFDFESIAVRGAGRCSFIDHSLSLPYINPSYCTKTGAHIECRYKLLTYGIPADILPVDNDGTLLLDNFKRGIEESRIKELLTHTEKDDKSETVVTVLPTKLDVLLGRGRPYQEHHGNRRLATMIDQYRSRYEAAPTGKNG